MFNLSSKQDREGNRMDRRTIRALAMGIMLGALGMFSVSYFTASEEVTASGEDDTTIENPSAEDTVTLTTEEYSSLQVQLEEWEKRVIDLSTAQANAEDQGGQQENSEDVTRLILTIESGMTAPEVGEILAQYDIVSDPLALNDYLREQQLTDAVQIGRYELNSTLSIEEIAQLITR